MKRYTIGLITGILLTASAFMFMGAKNNEVGRYVEYAIPGITLGGGTLTASMLDTKTAIVTMNIYGEESNVNVQGRIHLLNGKQEKRRLVAGKWSDWEEL